MVIIEYILISICQVPFQYIVQSTMPCMHRYTFSIRLHIVAGCCIDHVTDTYCGLVTPYVDFSSVRSDDIFLKTISQEMPLPSITKIRLKIAYKQSVRPQLQRSEQFLFEQVLIFLFQPFKYWSQNISGKQGQNHGCGCPDSWRRQVISSHGIDCARQMGACFS